MQLNKFKQNQVWRGFLQNGHSKGLFINYQTRRAKGGGCLGVIPGHKSHGKMVLHQGTKVMVKWCYTGEGGSQHSSQIL
jgi:hypothetical protein